VHEPPCFGIAPLRTANDLASTVRLFKAYASSLDIAYQDFEGLVTGIGKAVLHVV
jgi:hypothetical protein